MSGSFSVDVQQLDALARELKESVAAMTAARHSMETTGPRTTGSKNLDHACDDFQDKWGYGLQQIRETAEAVTQGLEATAKAYRATEDALSGMFRGALDGGAGPGPRPGPGRIEHGGGQHLPPDPRSLDGGPALLPDHGQGHGQGAGPGDVQTMPYRLRPGDWRPQGPDTVPIDHGDGSAEFVRRDDIRTV
ncbi:WXG100 family type VII secretion target [Streptomyces sp. NPDC001380]|uniref:WXG100 family type VII secretion target n=1 Tax=Streptomyces sp. NPDC001380 TaxID=3364566 RepID=UPI0036BFB8C8